MKRVGHSQPVHVRRSSTSFSGNWHDTPGKYFWQAYYYPKGGVIGTLNSGIGCVPDRRSAGYSRRIRSTASSSRSSGVVSEIRKKPSPLAP